MFEFTTVNTHHYQMINNVFGRFVSGMANYLKTELFPRSQDAIISTYEKAVEHTRQRKKLAGENWSPKYPFLIIDPQIDLEPDPQAGRFFHGYPNFLQKFSSTLYKPRIYDDDNMYIAPVLNRYRGTIEIILYNSSIYEAIDNRVLAYQFFGGLGRPIFPQVFEGIIIIPEEYRVFNYVNPYTNENCVMDWDSSNNKSEVILIKNINKEKLVFPFHIRPYFTLTNVSDGADKYGGGGGDVIGDHRLTISLDWEASLPTHMVFVGKHGPIPSIPMEFTFATGFKSMKNPITQADFFIPKSIQSVADFGNETVLQSHPEKFDDSGFGRSKFHAVKLDLVFSHAYNYILTDEDVATLSPPEDSSSVPNHITIPLGESVLDERYLRVHTKYGFIDRDTAWRLGNDDQSIELLWPALRGFVETDDVFSILIYQEDPLT